MPIPYTYGNTPSSLPSRECGLKYKNQSIPVGVSRVTPFTGVWIEITFPKAIDKGGNVTPFTGVWIEITSLLKPPLGKAVTPFTGVWIEIDK